MISCSEFFNLIVLSSLSGIIGLSIICDIGNATATAGIEVKYS